MSQDRFAACVAEVLRLEGGYVDDPRDRGGPTNRGVTLEALSQAEGRPADLAALRTLTPEGAAAVYQALYWAPAGCGSLTPGLDLLLFDTAVNMGVGAAVRLLQQAAGAPGDGLLGPASRAAVGRVDPLALIGRMAEGRRRRYRALPSFPAFGAGWLHRVDTIEALALEAARAAAATAAP